MGNLTIHIEHTMKWADAEPKHEGDAPLICGAENKRGVLCDRIPGHGQHSWPQDEPESAPTWQPCEARNVHNGYTCTDHKGHTGCHEAYDAGLDRPMSQWEQDQPEPDGPESDGPPEGMRRVTVDVHALDSADTFREAAVVLGERGWASVPEALEAIADAIEAQA